MNKRKGLHKHSLIVTPQAIQDFRRLTTKERLQWLDETRAFLSQTLPARTKKIYDLNRGV